MSGNPNNHANRSTDRVPYLGRNSIIGPNFAQWHLRLWRDFPVISERVRLRLLGGAFNLPNGVNFNALQNTRLLSPEAGSRHQTIDRKKLIARSWCYA